MVTPAPKRRFLDLENHRSQPMNQSGKKYGVEFRRFIYVVLCAAIVLFVVESGAQAQSLMTRHVREANIKGQAKFVGRLLAAPRQPSVSGFDVNRSG